MEHVTRWPAPPAHGRHIQLLSTEPTTTPRRTWHGNSTGTNTTIRSPTNNTQHSGSLIRHHNGSTKTANSDKDTSHRGPSGTRRQELDANSICTRLQFTKNITKPILFEAPKDIIIRPMMTFQQEDREQQIHQFLGVISHPTRYCFKIWKILDKTKIGSAASQRSRLYQHHPNPRLRPRQQNQNIATPRGKTHNATIISSHTSPSIGWLKLARVIPEWII